MKCEECLARLDLYFDGELGAAGAAAVADHLGGCRSCARAYQGLRDEQALYLSYACDAAESPAFWDDLLSRARAERLARRQTFAARLRGRLAASFSALAAPRFSPTATAAMLLAAVGLTAAVVSYVGPREGGPDSVATLRSGAAPAQGPNEAREGGPASGVVGDGISSRESRQPAAGVNPGGRVRAKGVAGEAGDGATGRPPKVLARAPRESAPDRLVREAEQKYLAAIAILSRDAGRRRPRMEPAAVARFERALSAIDRSIVETRAAAREHPRDPVAVQYMLAAYARKVEVLREMAHD